MINTWTESIGFIAATCTTLAFVPQLVKIRKQGGRDLSYLMLLIYLAGLCLWLVYGLRLHAPAIIAANVVSIVLVSAATALKAVMDGRVVVVKEDCLEEPSSPASHGPDTRLAE
jgi:MtN3 and saliva related transmembrane protein